MAKSSSREINWSRLIIVAAVAVLATAVWTSQKRTTVSQSPVGIPVSGVAAPAPLPADPPDAAGWQALGESRFQAGQYAAAVAAYQHAVALAPGQAIIWAALGEARVMASAHDPMPGEALKDFQTASTIDPREPRARYFLAVAKDLTGDHRGAITAWLALLGDTPPGAPWDADLQRTIVQVGRIHGIDVAARIAAVRRPARISVTPTTEPTARDLAAASTIPPSQQQAMAQAMVNRLEQRLAADPRNGGGWLMLIRSRMTLDGPAAAATVLARAIAKDPPDAAQLRAQAAALGVK